MAHILLDTHVILFTLGQPERLSLAAQEEITNPDNIVFYSPLSIWEITIKHAKHPEDMPVSADEILQYCKEAGYRELQLTSEQVCKLSSVEQCGKELNHKDPFDQMLLCQALADGLTLFTKDGKLLEYRLENVVGV